MVFPVVAVEQGDAHGSYSTTPTSAWTTATMPHFLNGAGASNSGVAYSPHLDLLLAITDAGDTNNNALITSADHGATWVGQVCPDAGSWGLEDVCWSPDLNIFVIVSDAGPTTTKRILTSTDGVTFIERTIPDASKSLRCVCWSHDLSIFLALGDGNYVITSTDGITWTVPSGTAPTDTNTWMRVTWCGGSIQQFFAVGRGGATWVATKSPTGANWTMFDGATNTWDCCYSDDLGYAVIVRSNSPHVTYSTDLSSWTDVTAGIGSDIIKGICWSKSLGLFVGVGVGTNVITSADGHTWTGNTAESAPGSGNSWWRVVAVSTPTVPPPTGPVGPWASTEKPDVMRFTGLTPDSGTFNLHEAPDVFRAVGYQPNHGTFNPTEAPDKFAAVGNVGNVVGAWFSTENPDKFLAIGAGASAPKGRRIITVT